MFFFFFFFFVFFLFFMFSSKLAFGVFFFSLSCFFLLAFFFLYWWCWSCWCWWLRTPRRTHPRSHSPSRTDTCTHTCARAYNSLSLMKVFYLGIRVLELEQPFSIASLRQGLSPFASPEALAVSSAAQVFCPPGSETFRAPFVSGCALCKARGPAAFP